MIFKKVNLGREGSILKIQKRDGVEILRYRT